MPDLSQFSNAPDINPAKSALPGRVGKIRLTRLPTAFYNFGQPELATDKRRKSGRHQLTGAVPMRIALALIALTALSACINVVPLVPFV